MKMESFELERKIGIETYLTSINGIGGCIKKFPEDFIVKELLIDEFKKNFITINKIDKLSSKYKRILCILKKKDLDTLTAIKNLAKELKIKTKEVSFAGIKDKKAITFQFITVPKEKLKELFKIKIKNLKIHPVAFVKKPISSKMLYGNLFDIKIRDLTISDSSKIKNSINAILKEIELKGGFPNFYGYQRFGTIRPITHLIGKSILKQDFKEAIMTFLTYSSPFESPISREMREELKETLDFKKALKKCPSWLFYEKLILKKLVRNQRNYVSALKALPIQLRKLFIQSYQSYLFNRFLSERIKNKLPLNKACIGDWTVGFINNMPTEDAIKVTESNIKTIDELIKKGIRKIALPIIGYASELSNGVQGEIEKKIIEEEGIKINDFRIKKMPELSLKGKLRIIAINPESFQFKIMKEDGISEKVFVRMRFKLIKEAYATIILREIMKPKNLISAGF